MSTDGLVNKLVKPTSFEIFLHCLVIGAKTLVFGVDTVQIYMVWLTTDRCTLAKHYKLLYAVFTVLCGTSGPALTCLMCPRSAVTVAVSVFF